MTSSQEQPLTERQSLDLIQTMIRQAQNRLTDDGSHLIWWGALVTVAALGHFVLLRTAWAEQAGWVWLLMPIGGIGAVVIARRQEREQRATTFIDRVMGGVWGSVGAAIGMVFVLAVLTHSGRIIYPVILLLYGIGLFATSIVVRFRVLTVASVGCWVLAVVAAVVDFEGQLLCMAGAALTGFLIPGLIVRNRYNQKHVVPTHAASI